MWKNLLEMTLFEPPDPAIPNDSLLLIFSCKNWYISFFKSFSMGFCFIITILLLLFQIHSCIPGNDAISNSEMGSENFSKIPQVLCCHSWVREWRNAQKIKPVTCHGFFMIRTALTRLVYKCQCEATVKWSDPEWDSRFLFFCFNAARIYFALTVCRALCTTLQRGVGVIITNKI